ncbi:MAG: hypothetical protein IJE93_09100 [Clostridia bacterium]|nr:hypothetical protein [Clostridia bacterium]
MLKIAGIIVCEIIIYSLLKQYRPEFAPIAEFAALVLLIFMLGSEIRSALSSFYFFFDGTGIASEYTAVLIKVLGLSLVTQFSADMCRDSGENALASKVEFAGKVLITTASIPVIKGFMGFVAELVENL